MTAPADTLTDLWPIEWRQRLPGAVFTMVAAKGTARRFTHAALTPPPAPSAHLLALFGSRPVSSPEEAVEDYVRAVNEERADSWFGVAARTTGLDGFHQGTKAQLAALPGLWLDVDIGKAGHASTRLPESLEVVITEYLAKITLEPTRVHATGGGIHCFWLLDAPIVFATATTLGHAVPEIQALAKRWQEQFIAIGRTRGEHVDDTSDVTRILRLPGTSNWKTGAPRPVTVLASGGARYSLDEIRAALKDVTPLKVGLGTAAPSGADVPGAEPWTAEETMKELPRRLRLHAKKRPERAAVIAPFLNGRSYSSDGEHHVVRQRLVSWIAFLTEGRADVAAVAELNARCYEGREAPADAFEKFEQQLTAALSQAHGKISAGKAREAEILEGLRRREEADRRFVP